MVASARIAFFLIAVSSAGFAQQPSKNDPVQWTLEAEPASVAPGGRVLLKFRAKIEEGWHLYAPTTSKGPAPTKITLAETAPVTIRQLHQPAPIVKRDEAFDNDQEYFEEEVVFLIEADVPASAAAGDLQVVAQARYQACSGTLCLRTKTKTASVALRVDPGARAAAPAIPAGYAAVKIAASAPAAAAGALPPIQMGGAGQSEDLGRFLLLAFGFGLAAIFTPCVFPMIPFVMSDFLNRKNALGQAALFCGGIIVSFTVLGLALTAALGPFGVVQLGSNPWVNAFIFSIFVVFGFSMLGAFEIMLPSGLVNKANEASQGGGSIRSMLMGLTFSLTSFACVGPFVGTLLAASVQGGGARPLLGMATFAAGLATPFFFLAMFPSLLQRLPKSGGWLPRVKTVMGFIILAAALKYLSNIDQVMQWGLLTRERFLAAWIVLFAMPGLYLLGFLRMEGIKADATLGVARTLIGAAFLIFAVSLWPGMSCQRLGEIDAYLPACAEGALPGVVGAVSASGGGGARWSKNDYRGALARAKAEGKTVLVAFTGYACTNCHWMKANMFTRPEVSEALQKFVLVELYTDGTDAPSEENQKLQEGKFATVAIPHYAIVDGDEKIIASFAGLTKDPAQFLKFLESGKAAAAL